MDIESDVYGFIDAMPTLTAAQAESMAADHCCDEDEFAEFMNGRDSVPSDEFIFNFLQY